MNLFDFMNAIYYLSAIEVVENFMDLKKKIKLTVLGIIIFEYLMEALDYYFFVFIRILNYLYLFAGHLES